ncbi:hypothetical protein M569_10326, partial [Genlisea aurea]
FIAVDDSGQPWALPLYKALNQGSWEVVRDILNLHPAAITARLTPFAETPLLVAVKAGQGLGFIRKLVALMPPEALALTDYFNSTALHAVAVLGNVRAARILVGKNADLPMLSNVDGLLPVHLATMRGHRKMTLYLLSATKNDGGVSPFQDAGGPTLVQFAVTAGFYDLALYAVEQNPKLAWETDEVSPPLELLAMDSSAFRSGANFNLWKSLLYSLPPLKRIRVSKAMHCQAVELVKRVCEETKSLDTAEASSLLTGPFLLGARNGIHEMVKEILDSFPHAITFVDDENHSVFHLAVLYRHEKIFKLVHQQSGQYKMAMSLLLDNKKNNILHLVGHRQYQDRLELAPGAVLQMQRELQWYKEVEKFVIPQERKSKNASGKMPLTVFHEEHRELISNETQWMIGMATSCSVAASLIATVAFAAAITVPGGNNPEGFPIFSGEALFLVFAVSDAMALLTSVTTVLSFLSIFTSRYAVNDFLRALPNRLIIGLISLFFSVACLMIAFGSTVFLVVAQQKRALLLPVILASCAPIILFASFQFPPLCNMIASTYGPSIF